MVCSHVDPEVFQARDSILPRHNVRPSVLFWAIPTSIALGRSQPESILLVEDGLSLLTSVLQRLLCDLLLYWWIESAVRSEWSGHVGVADSSSTLMAVKRAWVSIFPASL